ncbi:MAG: hypothetical protein AB7G93_15595 [Bdellovibrionales bacterium]
MRRLLSALKDASPGMLVTVGTERGFMEAANAPSINRLVIIDKSEAVITYNQINILLLRMAKDRDHYLRLRLRPDIEEWNAAARFAGLSSEEQRFLVRHQAQWKIRVAEHYLFRNFHRPPRANAAFAEVNYLFDDGLFAPIQDLARTGGIETYHIDLEDLEKVTELIVRLRLIGLPLSILDLSNAWMGRYLSREGLTHLIAELNGLASDKSLLVITDLPLIGSFRYTVYTFDHIREYRNMEAFSRMLQRTDLIPRGFQTRMNPVGLVETCETLLRALWHHP